LFSIPLFRIMKIRGLRLMLENPQTREAAVTPVTGPSLEPVGTAKLHRPFRITTARLGRNGAGMAPCYGRCRLAQLTTRLGPRQGGRPMTGWSWSRRSICSGLMFCPDPPLEEALLDRLSCRRFCGLALDEATLDETTICRLAQQPRRAQPHAGCVAPRDQNELFRWSVRTQSLQRYSRTRSSDSDTANNVTQYCAIGFSHD
jgi:transposase-like protein DUF772